MALYISGFYSVSVDSGYYHIFTGTRPFHFFAGERNGYRAGNSLINLPADDCSAGGGRILRFSHSG
jgi:hypothetical protein